MNLEPSTAYQISVVTRLGTGDDASRSVPSEITGTTTTIPPGNIEVLNVEVDSITILWGETDDNSANGYIILLTPPDGGSYPQYLTLGTSRFTFPSLTAGKEYSITVQIAGLNEGRTISEQTSIFSGF
ncbi:uncharacterized protein LOC144349996 [Saccoglossus kowalevskii]